MVMANIICGLNEIGGGEMSLDVYLMLSDAVPVEPKIHVRRDGATVAIDRAEWDQLHPDREPVTVVEQDTRCAYQANITHNLNRMAKECDLYEPLWRPEEINATLGKHLIEPLRHGLARLRFERERLEQFNPPNGWGDYDGLCRFTADYLAACEQWPDALIEVWK